MISKTIIIGIAGASASGKSLLANTIFNELGSEKVVVIPEDSYYKDQSHIPMEERIKINYDHPNAFDHDLLHEHLLKLRSGEIINIPRYDHVNHVRDTRTRMISNHTIIVLEGILLFAEKKIT